MKCNASASYLTAGSLIFEPLSLKRQTSYLLLLFFHLKKGLDLSAFT